MISHTAYLSKGKGESDELALLRHQRNFVPIGFVKSPDARFEPNRRTTADTAGVVARRNTYGGPFPQGFLVEAVFALPVDLKTQGGRATHINGTRPVIQPVPVIDEKRRDLRYLPLLGELAPRLVALHDTAAKTRPGAMVELSYTDMAKDEGIKTVQTPIAYAEG